LRIYVQAPLTSFHFYRIFTALEEFMANLAVSVFERIKTDGKWTMRRVANPRNHRGLFYISWREGAKKHMKPCEGETLADAQKEADRKRKQLDGESVGLVVSDPKDQKRTPLATAIAEFIDERQKIDGAGTMKLYMQSFKDWGEFSDVKFLDEVTRKEILNFGVWLQKKKLNSVETSGWKCLRMNTLYKSLVRESLITRKDVKLRGKVEVVIYQPEEVRAFFEVCTPHDHLIFSFFHKSGFREREVTTLPWDDVDLTRGTVTVNERPASSLYAGFKHFKPKNGESRTVKLPMDLVHRLKLWRLQRPTDILVFPTYNGKEDKSLLRICKRIGDAAGVEGCKLHRWRSTCATDLLRQHLDLPTVAKILGHKDVKSTLVYLQAIEAERMGDTMDKAWAAIDQKWMRAPLV
jgi:integrase